MAQNIVLDTLPTVTRNGAGRKPTIVPTHLPSIMEAAGKWVVLTGEAMKTSTAQNTRKVLTEASVEGGKVVATTRHALSAEQVAPEGQVFVLARFEKKRRNRAAAAPEAVEAS
jgi:hypothetical protein